jgi:hypothetical protein
MCIAQQHVCDWTFKETNVIASIDLATENSISLAEEVRMIGVVDSWVGDWSGPREAASLLFQIRLS